MINWHFTPYAVPLFVGAAIMGVIAAAAWRRRSTPGALAMCGLSIAMIIYGAGYAFEIGSRTLEEVRWWLKVEYIGVGPLLPLLFMMILAYTGHKRLQTPLNFMILMVVPAITILLAWTNEQHEWIWRGLALKPVGDLRLAGFKPGGWYWVHTGYNWALGAAGIGLLVRGYRRADAFRRKQIAIILVGMAIPLAAYGVYLLRRVESGGPDLLPYSMFVTAIITAWGMFHYQLFDLLPAAREMVLASMADAVIVVDAHRRVIDVNPVACQLAGMPLESSLGRRAEEVFGAWFNTADPELVIMHQGEPHTYDIRRSVLRHKTGQPEGQLIVLRDITDRVRAEAALRLTNERLVTLRRVDAELNRQLKVRYVASLAVDAAMRMTLADAAFIGLAEERGIRVIEGLGNYPPGAVNEPIPTDKGITARVIRSRQAEWVRDVAHDPDHFVIVPDTREQITVPLLSGEKLVGVITLSACGQNRFTPEAFESVKLLATRVAIAIDNANMAEERERLIKELDAYAHTVAHDLKNPLTTICGFAELLLDNFDKYPDSTKIEYLGRIHKGGQKSVEIINALLLLASIRSQAAVELKPLDMAALVEDVLLRLSLLIDQCQARIVRPDSWPVALGYGPWVEEIWANYISNAIKYGGQPPRVELGGDVLDSGMIRWWVRDNGVGLTPDQQARLFRPFTRLQPSGVEGHGLGLSIVQRIVERLGGQVGVDSEAGQGSRFYFTLPAG